MLQRRIFPLKVSNAFFTTSLFMPQHFAFVAERASDPATASTKEIVGCILGRILERDTAYISTLLVKETVRRRGIGTLLCSQVPKTKVVRLHCCSSNIPALQLYSGLGFVKTGSTGRCRMPLAWPTDKSSNNFSSREALVLEKQAPRLDYFSWA